jgi:type IV pilus assembly protein PilB
LLLRLRGVTQDQPIESKRIGQLLVKEGIIDEKQLEQALIVQGQQTTYKPLGEILRDLGFVSSRKFHDVLLKYQKQIPLGELLVKMGVITYQQLTQALLSKKDGSKRLGQILVEKGLVTRSRLVDALCVQLGIPGMDKKSVLPDKALFDNISPSFLRRKRAMPLKYDKENRVLTVLLEDPTDKETIADLEKLFKADIEPVMLRTGSINHLLDEILDMWHMSR